MVEKGNHSTIVTEWSSIHHFYRPDLTTQNNCGLLCGIVQYSAPCSLNMPGQTRQLGFIQKIGWIFLPILNKRHICACLLYNTVPGQVQTRRPLQSNGNDDSNCLPPQDGGVWVEFPPYDLHTQHRGVGLPSYTRGDWIMKEGDNVLQYISVKTLCAIQSQLVLLCEVFLREEHILRCDNNIIKELVVTHTD